MVPRLQGGGGGGGGGREYEGGWARWVRCFSVVCVVVVVVVVVVMMTHTHGGARCETLLRCSFMWGL